MNQLKAFIDVCHLYGLAVLPTSSTTTPAADFDRQSIDYFDLPAAPGRHATACTSPGADWAGGRVFAFDRPDVRAFLIDNARMFLDEYHVDGLRFDEVTVIDANGGWSFCQDLTAHAALSTSPRRR